ncbi:hypothetical protein Btru_025576 [Bulinus truncatus]|nr:hypothetical protein Btru_025576 [Bulinus truncatus]
MSSKVTDGSIQEKPVEGETVEPVYAKVQKKKPKATAKTGDSISQDRRDDNSEVYTTGNFVKDSIFKFVDGGYKKFMSSQPRILDEFSQRMTALEQSQSRLCSDFAEFRQQIQKELSSLQEVTCSLQQCVQASIDQQEKFALSVHDQFTETSDHLGGQLMGVMKELQEVSNHHKHMVTSLSLIVSSYVCPSAQGEKSAKKHRVKSKTTVEG